MKVFIHSHANETLHLVVIWGITIVVPYHSDPITSVTSQVHYVDVKMGAIASQITSLAVVYSTVYSDADQRKHQSSASLAFVRGIHRGPVNCEHGPRRGRKVGFVMMPTLPSLDVVIMITSVGTSEDASSVFSLCHCALRRCQAKICRLFMRSWYLRQMCYLISWWRHQMETFSALLTLCEGNPPVTSGFPSQRPVTRSFDVSFDLRLNKRLSKQWRRRLFETPLHSLCHHCNGIIVMWSKLGEKYFHKISGITGIFMSESPGMKHKI